MLGKLIPGIPIRLLLAALFASGFFYGLIGFPGTLVYENASAAIFDCVGCYLFILVGVSLSKNLNWNTAWTPVFVTLCLTSGLILACVIEGKAEFAFWTGDSVAYHIPRSILLSQWITGRTSLPFAEILRPGLLTHLWLAPWFALFGATGAVTAIALLVLKSATSVLISKFSQEWFNRPESALAYIVFLAAPTVFFHTTVFYKEVTVTFLVSATLFVAYRYWRKLSFLSAFTLCGLVLCLAVERFYLALLLATLLPIFLIRAFQSKKKAHLIYWLAVFCGLVVCSVIQPVKFEHLWAFVELQRKQHMTLSNINSSLNYAIPYPLALAKFFLTPIFHPDKLAMFRGFSSTLTWGSFIHNAIMIAYAGGVIHSLFDSTSKTKWRHLIIQIPFIFLLLIGAYISPWAGRVRDSFYPLICIYAYLYFSIYLGRDMRSILLALRRFRKEPA